MGFRTTRGYCRILHLGVVFSLWVYIWAILTYLTICLLGIRMSIFDLFDLFGCSLLSLRWSYCPIYTIWSYLTLGGHFESFSDMGRILPICCILTLGLYLTYIVIFDHYAYRYSHWAIWDYLNHYVSLCLVSDGLIVQYTLIGHIWLLEVFLGNSVMLLYIGVLYSQEVVLDVHGTLGDTVSWYGRIVLSGGRILHWGYLWAILSHWGPRMMLCCYDAMMLCLWVSYCLTDVIF